MRREDADTTGSARRRRHLSVLLIVALGYAGLFSPGTAGAATASWRFEPSSFDFGVRLPAEGPTSAEAFRLVNTGEASLTPGFIGVSNQDGSGFELASDGCGLTLAPGADCTIEIIFDPSSGGRKEGTLTVESSSPVVGAATAQLLGSGGEPIVVVDPPTVTFDTVPIPISSMPTGSARTVTVTNAGSADLFITGMEYEEGGLPSDSGSTFVERGDPFGPGRCLRVTIAPGGSCSINLEFSPQSPGTYTAKILLEDEAPGSPQVILLYGTAVPQAATSPPPAPQRASLPRLTHKPPLRTRGRAATFKFSATPSPNGFLCRSIKGKPFRPCASPLHLRRLKPGLHVFSVRGIGPNGEPGPVMTYHWRIVR
ncbi:MAG TPA: choice-of-anchor D domain-containing protein [Solirubrobacterales bacterium]|nr:choice-of-anchor D domain-containing protein [Solirubrobacterales bacterium]